MATERTKLNSLTDALNSASSNAWRALVSYGTLGIYLLLGATGVSHAQLLLGSSVKLPLIELEVPLVTFYIVAPILLVLTYIYAAIQFAAFYGGLIAFEEELKFTVPISSERRIFRTSINSSLLTNAMGINDTQWPTRLAAFFTLWIVLAAAPLIILIAVQLAILPLHNASVTWVHRILILVAAISGLILLSPIAFDRRVNQWRAFASYVPSMAVALLAVFISFGVILIPEEPLENIEVRLLPHSWLSEVPFNDLYSIFGGQPTLGNRKMPILTYQLFEAPKTPFGLRRNLLLSGISTVVVRPSDDQLKRLGEKAAWVEFGKGLNLSGRDLRFADLSGADLRKADLRGASLRGATLHLAKLDYVRAVSANFRDIPNCVGRIEREQCDADFTGADLSEISARFSHFDEARMVATNFFKADLDDAILDGAQLDLAGFEDAVMYGASLRRAWARGAIFLNSKLDDANLQRMDARAADFTLADVMGSDMTDANLSGAWMHGTYMVGTTFLRTKVAGASFDGTQLTSDLRFEPDAASAWFNFSLIKTLSEAQIGALLERVDSTEARAHIKSVLNHYLVRAEAFVVQKDSQNHGKRGHSKESSVNLTQSAKESQPEVVVQEPSIAIPKALAQLACPPGHPNVFLALGVLRRTKKEGGFFETPLDDFEDESTSEWRDLEKQLESANICGPVAQIVAQHQTSW